ncbi:hypothetical protein BKA66DRAFT_474359 [Pyrenochaeta sp. MPI-SDFR-AT-0127]|nr:hypothetical protein BKA66DRAFT_474359 [Pyrenochaeta sp. MPI-SDFR-AT-0127]
MPSSSPPPAPPPPPPQTEYQVSQSTKSVSSPVPSPAVVPEPVATAKKTDPIALVEAYLEEVKKAKEKELLEANRVLSWIDQRTPKEKSAPSVPDVESFRQYDDETDVSYSDASSDITTQTVLQPSTSAQKDSVLRSPSVSFRLDSERQMNERFSGSTTGNSSPSVCSEVSSEPYQSSERTTFGDCTRAIENRITDAENYMTRPGDLKVGVKYQKNETDDTMTTIELMRQELTMLKNRLKRKEPSWFGAAFYARLKKTFRRLPREGTQRLEWICECGDEMFDDFPITDSAQYQQMLAFLNGYTPSTRPSGHGPPSDDLESGILHSSFSSLPSNAGSSKHGKSLASTAGSSGTYIGSSNSQIFTRKFETKLTEIQLTTNNPSSSTICTDSHLFRQIHARYTAMRKHTWRRFFYHPCGIKFVHFGVQTDSHVDFFNTDPLPTEDVLATKRYEYNLDPPILPPMTSRNFLHYFYKHSSFSHIIDAKWMARLPKKLGESLVRDIGVNELREGWGIQILEGPNKVVISWAAMALIVLSFLVSLVYDLCMKGGDSGFAIGQWMVAGLAVGLSAVWFGLEDEVVEVDIRAQM